MAPQRPFSRALEFSPLGTRGKRSLSPSKQRQSLDVVVEISFAKAPVLLYWGGGNPWSSKMDRSLSLWPSLLVATRALAWELVLASSRLTHTSTIYKGLSWGKSYMVKSHRRDFCVPCQPYSWGFSDRLHLVMLTIWYAFSIHRPAPTLPGETGFSPSKCCLAMGSLAPVSFGFRARCSPPSPCSGAQHAAIRVPSRTVSRPPSSFCHQ